MTTEAASAPISDRLAEHRAWPEPGRRGRLLVTTLVLGAAAVHTAVRLSDAFYFHHDDLLQFSVSQEHGLGWELLGLNVFGHFAPFNRLVHFAMVRVAEVDLVAGTAVAVALVLALLLSVVWLSRELGIPFWRRTAVLTVTGFSVAVLDTAVWLDAAVHILAALAVTYTVVAAHVRARTTGRARWDVLSVVVFALGFATQERTAFALPLIVLVDLFLLGAGRPWRHRLALLWSARAALAAMLVLSVVAVVLLRVHYAADAGAGSSLADVGQVFAGAVTTVLFPMLVGAVPSALPPAWVQLSVGLVLLLLTALLIRRNRANAGPLVLVLGTAVLYYGFLVFSPILVPETVEFTALRLNNAVYLLVPTAVALAALRSRPGAAAARGQARGGALRAYAPAAAVAALAALLVVTATPFLDRQWQPARAGHAYLEHVGEGRATWSDPAITLLPLRVPTEIAEGWSEDYGRHAHFLKYYDRDWAPGPLGERPAVLDQEGRVRDVVLDEVVPAGLPFEGGRPGCQVSGPGEDFVPFSLPAAVRGEPLFARISYSLETDGPDATAVLSGIEPDGTDVPSWQAVLPAGQHTVVLPLHTDAVVAFIVGALPHGATLCASAAAVVRPLYASDGSCVLVDEFGAPGRVTPCPPTRPSS